MNEKQKQEILNVFNEQKGRIDIVADALEKAARAIKRYNNLESIGFEVILDQIETEPERHEEKKESFQKD